MKALALILLTFAGSAQASGCFPWDVQLVSETPVVSIGTFQTTSNCNEFFCGLSVWSREKSEWHQLHLLDEKGTPAPTQTIGDLEVKIFDQYFVSSCDETHRYILGVDYNGKRYREVLDLKEL